MRLGVVVLLVSWLAGCGRVGFDARGDGGAGGDGASGDGPTITSSRARSPT